MKLILVSLLALIAFANADCVGSDGNCYKQILTYPSNVICAASDQTTDYFYQYGNFLQSDLLPATQNCTDSVCDVNGVQVICDGSYSTYMEDGMDYYTDTYYTNWAWYATYDNNTLLCDDDYYIPHGIAILAGQCTDMHKAVCNLDNTITFTTYSDGACTTLTDTQIFPYDTECFYDSHHILVSSTMNCEESSLYMWQETLYFDSQADCLAATDEYEFYTAGGVWLATQKVLASSCVASDCTNGVQVVCNDYAYYLDEVDSYDNWAWVSLYNNNYQFCYDEGYEYAVSGNAYLLGACANGVMAVCTDTSETTFTLESYGGSTCTGTPTLAVYDSDTECYTGPGGVIVSSWADCTFNWVWQETLYFDTQADCLAATDEYEFYTAGGVYMTSEKMLSQHCTPSTCTNGVQVLCHTDAEYFYEEGGYDNWVWIAAYNNDSAMCADYAWDGPAMGMAIIMGKCANGYETKCTSLDTFSVTSYANTDCSGTTTVKSFPYDTDCYYDNTNTLLSSYAYCETYTSSVYYSSITPSSGGPTYSWMETAYFATQADCTGAEGEADWFFESGSGGYMLTTAKVLAGDCTDVPCTAGVLVACNDYAYYLDEGAYYYTSKWGFSAGYASYNAEICADYPFYYPDSGMAMVKDTCIEGVYAACQDSGNWTITQYSGTLCSGTPTAVHNLLSDGICYTLEGSLMSTISDCPCIETCPDKACQATAGCSSDYVCLSNCNVHQTTIMYTSATCTAGTEYAMGMMTMPSVANCTVSACNNGVKTICTNITYFDPYMASPDWIAIGMWGYDDYVCYLDMLGGKLFKKGVYNGLNSTCDNDGYIYIHYGTTNVIYEDWDLEELESGISCTPYDFYPEGYSTNPDVWTEYQIMTEGCPIVTSSVIPSSVVGPACTNCYGISKVYDDGSCSHEYSLSMIATEITDACYTTPCVGGVEVLCSITPPNLSGYLNNNSWLVGELYAGTDTTCAGPIQTGAAWKKGCHMGTIANCSTSGISVWQYSGAPFCTGTAESALPDGLTTVPIGMNCQTFMTLFRAKSSGCVAPTPPSGSASLYVNTFLVLLSLLALFL